jgi:hypothetical protein
MHQMDFYLCRHCHRFHLNTFQLTLLVSQVHQTQWQYFTMLLSSLSHRPSQNI